MQPVYLMLLPIPAEILDEHNSSAMVDLHVVFPMLTIGMGICVPPYYYDTSIMLQNAMKYNNVC